MYRTQNSELLKNNQELKDKLEQNQKEKQEITRILNKLLEEQTLDKQRKLKRKNRKPLPKKDPITEEIYEVFINRSYKIQQESYHGARLRLALTLLLITGVRISELLPLKVDQRITLFAKSWIKINRMKFI